MLKDTSRAESGVLTTETSAQAANLKVTEQHDRVWVACCVACLLQGCDLCCNFTVRTYPRRLVFQICNIL
jgi:hypothetical protein